MGKKDLGIKIKGTLKINSSSDGESLDVYAQFPKSFYTKESGYRILIPEVKAMVDDENLEVTIQISKKE
jgi:hypothetical protein